MKFGTIVVRPASVHCTVLLLFEHTQRNWCIDLRRVLHWTGAKSACPSHARLLIYFLPHSVKISGITALSRALWRNDAPSCSWQRHLVAGHNEVIGHRYHISRPYRLVTKQYWCSRRDILSMKLDTRTAWDFNDSLRLTSFFKVQLNISYRIHTAAVVPDAS